MQAWFIIYAVVFIKIEIEMCAFSFWENIYIPIQFFGSSGSPSQFQFLPTRRFSLCTPVGGFNIIDIAACLIYSSCVSIDGPGCL